MKTAVIEGKRQCPICGRAEGQMKNGRNRSGTQTILCRFCKKCYTLNPKHHAYDEATKTMALKMYYSGVSGRSVGKALGMNKANVYNWIKKKR